MLAPLFLCTTLAVGMSPPQEPDPERFARARARTYESLLRRRAPMGRARGSPGRCDEAIGRFCLQFDGDDDLPPSEPESPDVTAARRRAIEAYRRWLSADPSSGAAAGPLIRFLIEDGRATEAVSVARTHVWAAPGEESRLWLGLALHASGDFVAAEASFDSARALADPDLRRALDDVGVLLSDDELKWYRHLDPSAREAYHRRFWAFSDPSRLRPGNERRSEHYARQAWILILQDAPRTAGTVSWGDDRAEIVLRYGVPYRFERTPDPPFRLHFETNVVTYHDPRAIPLTPEALHTGGIPPAPPPGEASLLERDTVRSAYAPLGARPVQGLAAQVTRLPSADGWVLRADARLGGDSAGGPLPAPRVLLTVLDTLGETLARGLGEAELQPDSSLLIHAATELPPGSYVYQLEVLDDSVGLVGLERYRIRRPDGLLRLSDPMLVPLPAALVPAGGTVRVHAEVAGLLRAGRAARYAVEWALESAERPSVLARVVGWLARGFRSSAEEATAVRWESGWDQGDPVPMTFRLNLGDVAPGVYRLRLTVRDRVSGREATSYRPLRVVGPGEAGWPGGNRN